MQLSKDSKLSPFSRAAFSVAALVLGLLGATIGKALAQDETPKHLTDAKNLVRQIELTNTNYEHAQGKVVWSGTVESHTDCSGFIDHLLTHSYGYNPDAFKRWFDSRRPTAARYHDAIAAQKGFTQLQSVQDLRPGDLIAIKYLTQKENTGHIMLVAEAPQRMTAKKPFVDGTDQWSVTVIDSSESGHGPTDTRHKKGPRGKDHDGLGQGVFRIYATPQGQVVGFSWSTLNTSKLVTPDKEPLVLGRLLANFQP